MPQLNALICPRAAVTALLALLLGAVGGCSTTEKKPEGATEQEVYELAQTQLNTRNWTNGVRTLELLEENFPFGVYGEQAQLELIFAHYKASDFEPAIAVAERFIRLHPQHRNADYAYYMRGLASFNSESGFLGSLFGSDNTNRDPGGARDSFEYFAEFVRRYPESPYAPDAQKRMVYLRNTLARAEIHVANYYFTRGAYLAALNRGQYVLENFPNTPAIPDALAVIAQAQYLLGNEDLGADAARVLAANYPDHPALDDTGKFDNEYVNGRGSRNWISYATLGLFDRRETRGFDTRDLYNPEYGGDMAPPSPPAP